MTSNQKKVAMRTPLLSSPARQKKRVSARPLLPPACIFMAVVFGFFPPVFSDEPPKLLSDNAAGKTFAADGPRIQTGAVFTWIHDGEYPSDDEFWKTRFASDGATVRIQDGSPGANGNSLSFGHWGGLYYANFIVDLQSPYLVTGATLYSVQKAAQGIESFRVLLSADGKRFIEAGAFTVPDGLIGPAEGFVAVPLAISLEKPTAARYVQFIVKKNPARFQAIIGEAAVWGTEVPKGDISAWAPEKRRPNVAVKPRGIGSGALTLDWSDFASEQAKSWRLYRSDKPFENIADEGCEKIGDYPVSTKRTLLYPLSPGDSAWYGVTAIYDDGEFTQTQSAKHAVPEPLACGRFSDMLGVNHYWGGGGAKTSLYNSEAWELATLDLLEQTPFRFIRWWINPEKPVLELYRRGIEATSGGGSISPLSESLGVRVFSGPNEPHLSGMPPEECVKIGRGLREKAKAANPANVVYGPSVGVNDKSLNYLRKFYEAGGKGVFDAIDLHTYIETGDDFHLPTGLEPGSPETLLGRVEKVKELMREFGDTSPLTASEFGYSDSPHEHFHGHITPQNKAEFLVRGLILHNVLGFRRVMVYAFRDEGTDPYWGEHLYGILTRDGQKKPAFAAICVLGRILGDTVYDRPMTEIEEPRFGYVFRNADNSGEFVSVVWNGAAEETLPFKTAPGALEIIDMFGESRMVETAPDGTFTATIGRAPVYFRGKAPVNR